MKKMLKGNNAIDFVKSCKKNFFGTVRRFKLNNNDSEGITN